MQKNSQIFSCKNEATTEPLRSFTVKEKYIGSTVSEILLYGKKIILLYIKGFTLFSENMVKKARYVKVRYILLREEKFVLKIILTPKVL